MISSLKGGGARTNFGDQFGISEFFDGLLRLFLAAEHVEERLEVDDRLGGGVLGGGSKPVLFVLFPAASASAPSGLDFFRRRGDDAENAGDDLRISLEDPEFVDERLVQDEVVVEILVDHALGTHAQVYLSSACVCVHSRICARVRERRWKRKYRVTIYSFDGG